jgi:hypothetical protein
VALNLLGDTTHNLHGASQVIVHGQSGFVANIAARIVTIEKAMEEEKQVKSLYRAPIDPAEEHMTKFALRHRQW